MFEFVDSAAKSVLIASSTFDRPTWGPVAERLSDIGYEIIAYEADLVANSHKPLDITVDKNGLSVNYDGLMINTQAIDAAWYRRPSIFAPWQNDKAKQLSLDEERKDIQTGLWETVPEAIWLNAPSRIVRAEQKLTQLTLANSMGFVIPKTVITNRWEDIAAQLPEDIILKMSRGVVYDQDEIKCLYTTPLKNDTESLPIGANPFPGFWQPCIQKEREWRITVVGADFFDAAIYTFGNAKDDWRKPEHALNVEFRKENFPDDLKEKCLRYLGALGLKFGAFDFIEDHNGKITFLECNPNGQYMWLEESLGLPISAAITAELIKIAIK